MIKKKFYCSKNSETNNHLEILTVFDLANYDSEEKSSFKNSI